MPTEDISNAQARTSTYQWLKGMGVSAAAMRAATISAPYNDAMVTWFAVKYPSISFMHIHPGMVTTPGFNGGLGLGWLLAPLEWIFFLLVTAFFTVSPQDCTEWMLCALLDPAHARGMLLANRHGDVVSARVFYAGDVLGESDKKGFLNGTRMKGFGGTDMAVRAVCGFTEQLTKEK
ncbi:hypothetical protein C8J57DRAFT_1532814 [Mycena rebaudengoi]|nr:hypothetical protein C8J57DRAFT_1532814 [Mycena rebaudengoi]